MTSFQTMWVRLRFLLGTLLLLTGFPSFAASASAQAPTEISFQVSSYTCDTDPGNVSVAAGNIPDTCTPDTGAAFTVATDDGTFSVSCTTDAGSCTVQVPNEANVTVTEDIAPAGTAPRENPISTQAVTEFAGALFINLPTAAPTEVPTVEPTVAPPTDITFRINKYTCDQDPGNISPNADNIPDYCTPTAGVMFQVTAEDGTSIGSCTTDDTGLCSLQAPNEATVIVTEDTTTAPAGTVPRENPITAQVVTEFAGAVFVNLPAPTEVTPTPVAPEPTAVPAEPTVTPAPPTGLPSTGSGPENTASGNGLMMAALGTTLLCGSIAVVIRRRNA